MPAENMESERYLAKYGYLVSIFCSKEQQLPQSQENYRWSYVWWKNDYRRSFKVEEKNNKGIEWNGGEVDKRWEAGME